MIPYDDLVAALSAWRARQGLPVSTMGGAAAAAAADPSMTPAGATPVVGSPTPGSGPRTAPPGAPPRTAPPGAPPPGRKSPTPAPLDEGEEEVDAALLDEASYDNEGGDFAMSFGQGGDGESSTAISSPPSGPPQRDTQPSTPPARKNKNRKNEW